MLSPAPVQTRVNGAKWAIPEQAALGGKGEPHKHTYTNGQIQIAPYGS